MEKNSEGFQEDDRLLVGDDSEEEREDEDSAPEEKPIVKEDDADQIEDDEPEFNDETLREGAEAMRQLGFVFKKGYKRWPGTEEVRAASVQIR